MPKNKPKGFLFSAAATSETNSSDDCTQSDWRGKTASLLHTGSKIFFLGGGIILEVRVGGNILEGIPRFVQTRSKEGSSYLFNVYLF